MMNKNWSEIDEILIRTALQKIRFTKQKDFAIKPRQLIITIAEHKNNYDPELFIQKHNKLMYESGMRDYIRIEPVIIGRVMSYLYSEELIEKINSGEHDCYYIDNRILSYFTSLEIEARKTELFGGTKYAMGVQTPHRA